MRRNQLLSNVLSRLDQLGISYLQGQGTDITIHYAFSVTGWCCGRKYIVYDAAILLDDKNQTVYMYELPADRVKGLNLITKSVKENTIYFHWKFKKVSKKEKAMYPPVEIGCK